MHTPMHPKPANPAFCQAGSTHPSAQVFPIKESTRHLAYYNPKTGETKLIRTYFAACLTARRALLARLPNDVPRLSDVPSTRSTLAECGPAGRA
jgi:hypothetical protein